MFLRYRTTINAVVSFRCVTQVHALMSIIAIYHTMCIITSFPTRKSDTHSEKYAKTQTNTHTHYQPICGHWRRDQFVIIIVALVSSLFSPLLLPLLRWQVCSFELELYIYYLIKANFGVSIGTSITIYIWFLNKTCPQPNQSKVRSAHHIAHTSMHLTESLHFMKKEKEIISNCNILFTLAIECIPVTSHTLMTLNQIELDYKNAMHTNQWKIVHTKQIEFN